MDRDRVIFKTSIIGIIANAVLAGIKALIGLISGSVAIVLDAVNNLSDALSSVITIIGQYLSGKAPDKKHPLGHGRAEYIAGAVISVIILYAGVTSLVESVKKIFSPTEPDYSAVSLVIVALAVGVKVLLGLYVKKQGTKANSPALRDSGQDALNDAVISFSTLVAALVFVIFRVSVEAYLGALISLVIIKSGIGMVKEAYSVILGQRVDSEVSLSVKKSALGFEEVSGVFDLVLHSYGPDRLIGSCHIQVDPSLTADRLDTLERRIMEKVHADTGVVLTGISVYATSLEGAAGNVYDRINGIMAEYPDIIQLHGFNLDEDYKRIRFDVVISFESDMNKIYALFCSKVREAFPDYDIQITLDADISD